MKKVQLYEKARATGRSELKEDQGYEVRDVRKSGL